MQLILRIFFGCFLLFLPLYGEDQEVIVENQSTSTTEGLSSKNDKVIEPERKIEESTANLSKRKTNIALLPLKGSGGISASDAELITDRLNVELFKTEKVNLIERQQISSILSEQGFQESGACTDDACLVEVGQLLGVEEMVSGSAGKLGSMIIVNLRSIDVATGKIIAVVSRDIDGELQDLVHLLPGIAREIAGLPPLPEKIPEPKKKTVAPVEKKVEPVIEKVELRPLRNTAMLTVKSIPEGADVLVNGKKVGVTPFADNLMMAGKYKIDIVKNKFDTYSETIELELGMGKTVVANLLYRYAALSIVSEPAGASFTMGSLLKGVTPFFSDTILPGSYKLSMTLEGHVPITGTINALKGVHDTLEYRFHTEEYLKEQKEKQREANKGKRIARRVVFGLFAAGLYGTGAYYNSMVKENLETENNLYNRYMETPTAENPISVEEFNTRYNDYIKATEDTDDIRLIRNILYGSGGLFSFFFVLSIPF